MQKSRPLGVTILAYWALAGSGVLFVTQVFFLAGYRFTDDVFVNILGPLGTIAAPLGSGSISFLPLPLGILKLIAAKINFEANFNLRLILKLISTSLSGESYYTVVAVGMK